MIQKYAEQFEKKYNIKIICNKEDVPLGTGKTFSLSFITKFEHYI